MSIEIRSETASDVEMIFALTELAFRVAAHSSHTEQFIVNSLREAGQLSVSLVAEDRGTIVGHVAASPVFLSDGTSGWFGIGPISVLPSRQRQGIGTRLMEAALTELRRQGAAGCVVLGDPDYYRRFGFSADPAIRLPGVPAEYFQAVAFKGEVPTGTVSYHSSFDV